MARQTSIRRSARRGGVDAQIPAGGIPEITATLRPRIGSSQIDQFVLDHGPADVLRELVQNEFDGGGDQMSIHFGPDTLTVTGSGKPVTAKGWSRLSVIMGTGEVIGEDAGEEIDPKQNGIGSKNFGLRSVFYFSDRIHLRSNGKMAILDVRELKVGLQADPESANNKGVLIQAPLRSANLRKIPAFTIDREKEAFEEIGTALFPTLVKLALEGKHGGLQRLTVASDRLVEALDWRQTVKPMICSVTKVRACQRSGELSWTGRAKRRHEEVEFSRYVDVPASHQGRDYPDYYRSAGRVKIAVSLTIIRRKIDRERAGHFYYPLEAGQHGTGCAVSVSAPFDLNADRSRLSPKSEWNDWLNDQAANLVVDLVGTDWFKRFGPAAFEALAPVGAASPDTFQALVATKLAAAECWPTATGKLAAAKDLVVPAREELFGQVEKDKHLHLDLSTSAAVSALAHQSGAKSFTINSLVRLRCAGADRKMLATKAVEGEADYHYPNFPTAIQDLDFQRRSAEALNALRTHLSNPNRSDVAETLTTLTADGSLDRVAKLVLVPTDMWDACPVPLASRLHPDLREYQVLARQCRPFDLASWIKTTSLKADDGSATEPERLALYGHLIAKETKLSSQLLALVRRTPVLRDQNGDWAAASDMAWLSAKEQALLEPVLIGPDPALRRKALLERFRIRRAMTGDDLLAMGKVLTDYPEKAGAFEELLAQNLPLLTSRVAGQLSEMDVLRNQRGELTPPVNLHLPTAINKVCLESSGALVAGTNDALYKRLRCRETPSVEVLVEVIATHRGHGDAPPRPDQLYPALVEALRSERRPLTGLQSEPILFIGGAYAAPFDVVANPRAPIYIRSAVPTLLTLGPLSEAYIALGASYIPKAQHWLAFLEWADTRGRASASGRLNPHDRNQVRDGYSRNHGLPDELDDDCRCLLAADGAVGSPVDLREARFLENDYPELAEALTAAGANLKFADEAESSRTFFRGLRIQALSQVCDVPKVAVGAATTSPSWFRAERQLKLLHNADLPYALAELAAAHQKQVATFQPARTTDIRRKLAAIVGFEFVTSVELTFTLGKRVKVGAEAAIHDDALAMTPPTYKWEFDQILAGQLAQVAGAKHLPDVRSLVSSILPLLSADSDAERTAYLKRLGIKANMRSPAGPDSKEDQLNELGQDLVGDLFDSLKIQAPPAPPITPPASSPPTLAAPPRPSPAPPVLPDPSSVTLRVSPPQGAAPTRAAPPPSGPSPWRPSGWAPRTPDEQARDAAYGQFGEALVYRHELERLRSLGVADPESKVVWTSKLDPGADHDIQSIAEDGTPIWIEVKTTSGTDGRFDWPRREFEKALREGPRYQLWRVYSAGGPDPIAKLFEDPVALLRKSILRLEIGDLRAFVESR